MKKISRTLIALFVTGIALLSGASIAQAQTCPGTGSGALKVTSFPTGASVSVDGVSTGKTTPMSISLSADYHAVVVSIPNSGWNPDSRTVCIASGNNDLSITLLPILTVGPQGPQGSTGPQGPKGDKGDPGATGPMGAMGAQGPKGDRGDPGSQGLEGVPGATGSKGDKGDPGMNGAQGLPGAAGLQGPPGPQGPAGTAMGYVHKITAGFDLWGNDIQVWEQAPFVSLSLPDGAYILLVSFLASNANAEFNLLGTGSVDILCAFDDLTSPALPQRLSQYEFALSNNASGEFIRSVTYHDVRTFAHGANTTVGFSCRAGVSSPTHVGAQRFVFSAIPLGALTEQ